MLCQMLEIGMFMCLCRCSIVHRDVKPQNILIDDGYNAILGDMDHGVELPEDGTHVAVTNAAGTHGYEDRYKAEGEPVRVSEDLFSLGIGMFMTFICNSFQTTTCGAQRIFVVMKLINFISPSCHNTQSI